MNELYADREQSQIKHFALQKYLEAATLIIGSWNNFTYVDCCAGPWESRSEAFSDTSFGISVEILKKTHAFLRSKGKNPKFRALLIEERTAPYKELNNYALAITDDNVAVETRNWDFRKYTSEIAQYVAKPQSFAFVFIDPTGWIPAGINGLESLLKLKPGEVLINLMSSFIVRFLNDNATNMEEILGKDYREMRSLDNEEQEDEAVRRYCELIRKCGGFKYVCSAPS